MSAEMDALEQKVRRNSEVVDSAVTFITGVAGQIRDAAGDRTKSLALADELDQKSTALAQAIQENTPQPPVEGRRK